jgi:hypothetical protein
MLTDISIREKKISLKVSLFNSKETIDFINVIGNRLIVESGDSK